MTIMRNTVNFKSFEKDVNAVHGFEGIDKLNKLKLKYSGITTKVYDEIKKPPGFLDDYIKTKDLNIFLKGLIDKLNSNTINISVVAEVSSGKSTFLNALVFGKKILDAKMGETTAKVFKISYGENQDSSLLKKQIISINSKAKNNISNKNFSIEDINIEDYIVELKSDNKNLKKGIVLYDTPGFGTLNEKVMSKLIKEAVNRSDAVILLLDISKGLKKDESKFVKEALSYIKENKRFIVLNKFDASIDEDEDEDEIQDQINNVIEKTKEDLLALSLDKDKTILDKQTYYLSALKALAGKSKNDQDKLEYSRFGIFENSFWERIVEAKKETFFDSVNILKNEILLIIQATNEIIIDSSKIIDQTNSLVKNIDSVSGEVKAIVKKYSAKINIIDGDLRENSTIVFDKYQEIEIIINKKIESETTLAINSIPLEDVTENDFKNAVCKATEEINKEFKTQYKLFYETVVENIVNKEKQANDIIDHINNEMKSDKFKKLEFKEIRRVSKRNKEKKEENLNNSTGVYFKINKQNSEQIDTYDNTNFESYSYISGDSSDITDYTTAMSAGAAAGAGIGSVVPVVGTAIGAAVGAGLGAITSFFGSSSAKDESNEEAMEEMMEKFKHQQQQMQKQHQDQMQQMQGEIYKQKISQAKKDLSYDLISNNKEEVNKYLSNLRTQLDHDYRNTLSEIVSAIYNAKNILKDMQTIIEDPTEQKKIIGKHDAKINEARFFIENIKICLS